MKTLLKERSQGREGRDPTVEGGYSSDVTGLEEIIASSGISRRLWRLYANFWLICLFFPVLYLVNTSPATMPLLVAVAGLALFATVYLWVMWPYPLGDQVRARPGFRSNALLPPSLFNILRLRTRDML